MSIKVGYLNENYTLDNFSKKHNALVLNSYDDSNIIILNNDELSHDDIFINYKNNFLTGVSSNIYIFRDKTFNKDLMTISSNNVIIDTNLNVTNDLNIKDNLKLHGDKLNITSNVNINLLAPSNTFIISENNNDILNINSNTHITFCTQNLLVKNQKADKIMINIDDSNINIDNNVYIQSGKLFVNEISALNGGSLNITNAVYNATQVEDITIKKNLSVINKYTDSNIVPISILNNSLNSNILVINTSNFSQNVLRNDLCINNYGYMGIGTNNPTASLDIRRVQDNIINYSGDASGDVFKITKRANVGIGTNKPTGQVHIKRNDDLDSENLRRYPMLKIDMDYDSSKNISNIYNTYETNFTLDNNNYKVKTIPNISISSNLTNTNQLSIVIQNDFYILNNNIYSSMDNNINNISNIILPQVKRLQLTPLSEYPVSSFAEEIQLNTNIIYPSSNFIFIEEDASLRQIETDINGNYKASFVFLMMSKETKDKGGYDNDILSANYNASNFTNFDTLNYITMYDNLIYKIGTYEINCKLDFIFEKNIQRQTGTRVLEYFFNYTKITKLLITPPDFITLSMNSNFISSFSPYGTLSLGSQVPDIYKQSYLLYAPGNALLNTIKTNVIDTDNVNSNISFMSKNITNINNIQCKSLQIDTISMNNIDNIQNLNGSNLYFVNANFSNMKGSKLTFDNCSNDYVSFSDSNIHFKSRFSIGKNSNTEVLNNNTCMKITTDQQLTGNSTNGFYNRHNGLLVQGDTLTNPCISIKSINEETIPYFNIANSSSGYYFRIKKETTTTHFQLSTDNFYSSRDTYYNTNNYVPYFMQHIKEPNILSFGEQDIICIDCLNKNSVNSVPVTNYSSKISIGVPYGDLSLNGYSVKDYHKYFANNINTINNQYLLNIYGNVKIADINNNPIITSKSVSNKIITAINGEPDTTKTLKIYGNMDAYDIFTSNISMYGVGQIISSNIINYQTIKTNKIECQDIFMGDNGYVNTSNVQTSNIHIEDDIYIKINGEYRSLLSILTQNNLV